MIFNVIVSSCATGKKGTLLAMWLVQSLFFGTGRKKNINCGDDGDEYNLRNGT